MGSPVTVTFQDSGTGSIRRSVDIASRAASSISYTRSTLSRRRDALTGSNGGSSPDPNGPVGRLA